MLRLINWVRCFLLLLSISFGGANAATYSLPSQLASSPFKGCVLSAGTTYTCGAVSVSLNTVINFASTMTFNTTAFTTASGVTISAPSGVAININVASGAGIVIGNSNSIVANLKSGDNMTVGNDVSIFGVVRATGNSISYGTNTSVVGNTVADAQTFGAGSYIYGTCFVSSPNCVSPPIEWRFDETVLSGVVGEVKEASSNGFNGKSTNVTVAPTAKVCAGPIFSGSASDIQVPSSTSMNSAFSSSSRLSFSIWANPSAIQDSKLMQRGDTTGHGLALSSTLGWQASFRVGGVVYTASAGSLPVVDTWYHIAGVYSGSAVLLYVNGALTASTPATGALSSTSNLPVTFGSAVGSKYFNGMLDEPQIFKFALDTVRISSIYADESAGKNWDGSKRICPATAPTGLDHVEFVHTGSALTCTPQPVTVLACKTSASCYGDSASQYTSANVTVTPTPIAGAQWCSDSLCASTISGSVSLANNTTIYLQDATASTNTLAGTVAGATTTTVQCTNTTTSAFNATTACNTTFNASGFLVSVPNHSSCTAQNVTIQAVQSSLTSQTCVPAFQSTTKNLTIYSSYVNPTTGTLKASFNYVTSAGGATSAVANLSTASGTPTTLTGIYFDSTGTAKLTGFTYPDVGQVTLFPKYTGSAGTNDASLSMSAISGNTFIAAPASFVFGAVSSPQIAGNAFSVSVTATNACATPAATPNFGKETTPATVSLTSTNPQPAVGNSTAISQTLSSFTNGAANPNLTWKEVGTFDLVAQTSNYLGSALSVSSTKSAVGVFKPAYFDTVVTPACTSFTYSGQPFATTVTARATGGNITKNYAGATWAKAVTLSDANAVSGTFAPSPANTIDATSFALGTATNTAAYFTFPSAKTAPATIKVRAIDTDAVSSATGSEGTNYLRSGRLRMLNVYGTELLALPMSAQIQYWTGTGFALNTLDNCTAFPVPTSSSGLVFGAGTLTAGKTIAKLNGVSTGSPAVVAGDAGLVFSAPGAGSVGYVDATITTPSWLKYDWKGLGVENPSARATFGAYKSPLIYMRENF